MIADYHGYAAVQTAGNGRRALYRVWCLEPKIIADKRNHMNRRWVADKWAYTGRRRTGKWNLWWRTEGKAFVVIAGSGFPCAPY